jgi:hypothetical protein
MRRLPEAEAVASQRAAERAAERMNQRAREQIAEANERYQEEVVAPAERRGAFPTSLNYFSTTEVLSAVALHANDLRLGAPNDPPPPTRQDLTLRIHESFVRNFTADYVGGREMTDERAAELAREGLGEGDDQEFEIDPERRWRLTFGTDRAVYVNFEDQKLRITVFMEEIIINPGPNEEILNDVVVVANYNIVEGPEGPQFAREGEVQVEMGDPQSPAYRATIRRRFDRLFPEILPIDRLEPEGRWEKVGPLVLKEAYSDGGWLTLGYQMSGR